MRKVVGLMLVVGLVGCSLPTTARQGVFAVVTAYDGALKSAIAYSGLPRCDAGVVNGTVCSQASVVAQLALASQAALPTVTALEHTAADTSQSDSAVQVALTAAQNAVQAFTNTVTTLTGSKLP